MFAVAGRSANTAATANHHAWSLWNPSGSEAIHLLRVEMYSQQSFRAQMARLTARGTPGSTVTPDVDSHFGQRAGPASAPVLDLAAYSVQPTFVTPDMFIHWRASASNYALGMLDCPIPITIPPGSGLGFRTPTANAWNATDFTWVFDNGPSPFGGDAYYCGTTTGTVTALLCQAHLWNPSSTVALHVFLAGFSHQASSGTLDTEIVLVRTSTRGTPGTTVTPTADNHVARLNAPASGAVIDHGVTADPTFASSPLYRGRVTDRLAGMGVYWQVPIDDEASIDLDDCIVVPPGTGLAMAYDSAQALSTGKVATFGWYE